MQVRLRELNFFPAVLMLIFALQSTLNFNAIERQDLSYILLALTLVGTLFSIYLIVRSRKLSKMDMYIIFFLMIVAFSSLVHGTDIKSWVYMSLSVILLRATFFYYQDHLLPLIIGLTIGFNIGVYVQLYQLVTQPSMWMIEETKDVVGYILGGNYNTIGVGLLIALVFNFLCLQISKFFYVLVIPTAIVCIAMPIMVGSMTSATSIILFILVCLIPVMRIRRIVMGSITLSTILFQILVCFNGKGIENNKFMVWFIEDVLGKDITFTNRTQLWDAALRVIVDSPIWGYGFPDKIWYLSKMSSHAIGPHNILLGMLIYGGIIAALLYLYFLIYSCIQTFRVQNFWADCILAGITMLCLMMLMEVYPVALIFVFITIAEYYPRLKKQLVTSNE